MTPELAWLVIALVVGGGYLLHCAVYPFRKCWRCGGRTNVGDGRGNYRRRRACRVCGGQPYRRLGARLIGRGRE